MKNASLERNIYVSRDLIQWKDKGKSNTIYIHAFLGGRPVFSHDHLLTILFLGAKSPLEIAMDIY